MILHRAPLPAGSNTFVLVTPEEARYGKNVLELIQYNKLEEESNPMYVRSVTLNLIYEWDKAGVMKHVKSLYSMMASQNYHQLLIRFPSDFVVNDILQGMVGELKEKDFVVWSARSFQEAFSDFRKKLKEMDT